MALLPTEILNAGAGRTSETSQDLPTTLLPAETRILGRQRFPSPAAPRPAERQAKWADPREGAEPTGQRPELRARASQAEAGTEVMGSPAWGPCWQCRPGLATRPKSVVTWFSSFSFPSYKLTGFPGQLSGMYELCRNNHKVLGVTRGQSIERPQGRSAVLVLKTMSSRGSMK